MALHFRTLAWDTVTRPSAHIGIHSWPNISRGDEVLSSSNAWMREVVQRIKDSASPG